jgi:hypothetical protein
MTDLACREVIAATRDRQRLGTPHESSVSSAIAASRLLKDHHSREGGSQQSTRREIMQTQTLDSPRHVLDRASETVCLDGKNRPIDADSPRNQASGRSSKFLFEIKSENFLTDQRYGFSACTDEIYGGN